MYATRTGGDKTKTNGARGNECFFSIFSFCRRLSVLHDARAFLLVFAYVVLGATVVLAALDRGGQGGVLAVYQAMALGEGFEDSEAAGPRKRET